MFNVPARLARLFAAFLTVSILVSAVQADTVVQVNLNGYVTGIFGDQISSYQIQLYDSEAPITVTNFYSYANSNAYNNSIYHRDVPGFVLQGGGFQEQINSNNHITGLTPIATSSPIQNEFSSTRSNLRGTIAMAKVGGDPNSATSQWFVNLANNASNLDNQNGGFTVFGHVAGEGMEMIDAIAALPTYDLNSLYDPTGSLGSPFTDVPLAASGSVFPTITGMTVVSTNAWRGGTSGATTDWGTANNWGNSSIPDGKGVNVDIGSQTATNNVIDLGSAGRTVGNLYFTPFVSTTIQGAGRTLTIDNNSKTSTMNVLGSHTISAAMALNNNTVFSVNGNLTVSGNISGSGSLGIVDTGKLTLTGSNSYSGNTLVTSGTLEVAKAASLPGYSTSGKVTVSSGAGLIVRAGAAGQWVESEINTLLSTVALPGSNTLGINTSDADFAYGSSLTGSYKFLKSGSYNLLLTGSNAYTGTTEVVAGTLTAGKTAALPGYNSSGKITVDSGATLAVRAGATSGEWAASDIVTLRTNATFNSGSFLGIDTTGGSFSYGSPISGSIGLTKLGTNTLTLTGTNTFTGAVNINGGLLKAASLSNLGSGTAMNFNGAGLQFDGVYDPSARTMTFQSGVATLDTQGNTITLANNIGNGGAGGLTKAGTGTLILNGSNSYTGNTLVSAGTLIVRKPAGLPGNNTVGKIAVNSAATLGLRAGAASGEWAATDINTLLLVTTFNSGASLSIDTTGGNFAYGNGIGGSLNFTKLGANTLTFTGSNTYSGNTLVSVGTLAVINTAALPGYNASSKVAVSAGATLAVRAGAATGQWTAADIDTVRSNATFNSGSFLGIDTTDGDFAYGINLTGNSGLTKLGTNTLTLTGSNTYTGNTTVSAGTLTVSKTAALPGYNTASKVTVSSGATLAVRAGAASGEWAAADIDALRTNATFNSGSFLGIDTTSANFSYGSAITGSLGITKLGSNTLTLTGSNTFTGAVNINGGLIKAAALSNLGSGTAMNFSGGGLQFDGVYDPSARTMTFLAGGATLDTQSNNITLANAVGNGGAGGLTKKGAAGMLTLMASPNYQGATVLNGGYLILGNSTTAVTLPTTTAVSITASGAFIDTNGTSQTIASLAGVAGSELKLGAGKLTTGDGTSTTFDGALTSSTGGSLTKTGSGTFTMTGSNTYTGGTVVSAGILDIGKTVSLPGYNTSGKVTVNSGATLAVRVGATSGEWLTADIDTLRSNATFNTGSFLGIDTTDGDFTYATSFGGTIGLVKLGANTLTLTGSNTYAGNTSVNAGTLKAISPTTLPGYDSLGKVNVNTGATLAVRAGASGGEWTAANIDTLRSSVIFNTGAFLAIDTTSGNFSYSSAVTGSIGVTKLGSNTLTLTGSNTFTGVVNLNGGLIKAAALSNLGSSTSALNFNGGGLQFDGSYDPSATRTMTFLAGGATLDTQTNNITLTKPIGNGGAGGLDKKGSGILELDDNPTYTGATTIDAGILKVNTNKSTTLSTISGAGTLTVAGTTALTATSVNVGTITLSAGSQLTIAAISGGPGAAATADAETTLISTPETLTPVPEPGALTLIGMGALAMLFAARRKNRKRA
jgi:fibronectin-binding autotransporter adhesin